MKLSPLPPAALLLAALPLAAAPAPPATPNAILAAAPAGAWRTVDAARLLVMDLRGGGRVAIELAPGFAPVHVANIIALATAGWWNGTSVNRVQDDYVAQWGDASGTKPLPTGIAVHPPAEYERAAGGAGFLPLPFRDAYAEQTGHDAEGWPMAREGGSAWLVHCYSMVGAGRDVAPDTGSGAELYAVIGHAPRHLDRNIALVGRVLSGMEALSALPRGREALGFYGDPAQRVPIARAVMASDVPAAERPSFQVLRPGTPTFAAWVAARANRKDDFFVRPAGGVDICNAMAPVRAVP